MKDSYLQLLIALTGLTLSVVSIAQIISTLPENTSLWQTLSIIGYLVFAGGILWFAFKGGGIKNEIRWLALGVLYVATIPFFFWVGTWNGADSSNLVSNRLIRLFDFENSDDGWDRAQGVVVFPDGTTDTTTPFPGTALLEVTKEQFLTGASSLKVVTSVNTAGDFRGYVYREGTLSSHGITIYVMAPTSEDAAPLEYVQICIPSNDWICSAGTQLVPGEWTPLTIDLSRADNSGIAVSEQTMKEIAIQWRFQTTSPATINLYFDAGEVFTAGE